MRQLVYISGIAVSLAILAVAGYVLFSLPGIGVLLSGLFLTIVALLAVLALAPRLFGARKTILTAKVDEDVREESGIAKLARTL